MVCGYENIYDFCSNQYTYTYASFIVEDKYVVANTGYDGSVYRTDKNTQKTILLEPLANSKVKTCNDSDDDEGFTDWDCYIWYKNNGGFINNPPVEEYQLAQIDYINNTYSNLLENGILVSINNFVINTTISNEQYGGTVVSESTEYSILLPAQDHDIVNFSNILSLATLKNINNDKEPLPAIIDYYNNAHFLNYYNLTNILSNYFNKIKYYFSLKNNLVNNVLNLSSINEIQSQLFYSCGSALDFNNTTNISTNNSSNIIKFSTLTCEE